MSVMGLSAAKAYLDVIHNADDLKLQQLLDGAEAEAANFMGRIDLDDLLVEGELPADVAVGVLLLLQAAYQASPEDLPKYRVAAEIKLTPHRVGWGP